MGGMPVASETRKAAMPVFAASATRGADAPKP